MKILVDLKDYQPWGGAITKFNIIKENGKLGHLETYLEELYGEDAISAVKLNDLLLTDFDMICDNIGIEDPWGEFENAEEELEESFISKLNKQILSCLNEDEEDIELTSYNCTFKVLDDNTVIIFVDGNETDEEAGMELACDTTDPEVLYDDLEEQMDLVVAQDLMPDVNITGTEIVGYKYNEEAKQGSFEFNIFYEEV